MAWQFVLTDLNGNVHGEVTNADERKVVLPHMRVPSATMKLPLAHSLANTVMDTDTLLKCYRLNEVLNTKTLAFNGPVVSAEEVSEEGNKQGIAVVAAGPFWRVSKRFIGKGRTTPFVYGNPTAADLGLAAHQILDTINGEGFTGIGKGTRGAVTTGGFGPWWLKNAAEAIAELSAGVNSFEFVVDPIEPQSEPGGVGGWPRIGNLRIASLIGGTKPDAIFEYGTTKANVSTYSRAISREGMITRAVISVSGWPETPATVAGVAQDLITRTDATAMNNRGLFEDVVNDAGVIDATLRTSIADFHLLYRKLPREMVTFNPVVNAKPTPITDYMPGDTVRGLANVGGSIRFNALFRIWGITFDVDQNGNENVELELVRP